MLTMKCSKCGLVVVGQPDSCRNCGNTLRQPILIPFPGASPQGAAVAPAVEAESVPVWRIELQERVRAIRARRELDATVPQATPAKELGSGAAMPRAKPTNPIVEAALNRIRRSTEHEADGRLAAAPAKERVEDQPATTNTLPPKPAMVTGAATYQPEGPLHRRATEETTVVPRRPPEARVTSELQAEATDVGVGPGSRVVPRTTTDHGSTCEVLPESLEAQLETEAGAETSVSSPDYWDESEYSTGESVYSDAVDFDDSAAHEPVASSAHLRAEFEPRTATFMQRVRSGVIDAAVLLIANIPFVALAEMSNARVLDRNILLALGAISLVLYFYYTLLMLGVSGQTIGMKAVGVLVLDARSLNLPSLSQTFGRAIGFLLSVATAGFSFLIPIIDPHHRSLSDLISRTVVKSAFDEPPVIMTPWLYRSPRH